VILGAPGRVFGLYRDFVGLRSGVDSLKALRFEDKDISVLFPEAAVSRAFPADETRCDTATPGEPPAFIGGVLGWLTYVRPERAGIIAAALASLGVSKREAELYEKNLRGGGLLVCIRSSSTKRIRSARGALTITGAERVVTGHVAQPDGSGDLTRNDLPLWDRPSELAFMC
jgi:hypothetical protein